MEFETSSIVLLAVSCAISFGLGRTFVNIRDKKRKKEQEAVNKRAAQALRDLPPGPESRNKSKRKRQQQEQQERSKP
ncbi:MAG: hypothetical protein JWR74_834 [Polaromonas sp.]|jgi:hypothetical protein|nr:hypothetical protein [Polaromonas sp.]